MLKEKIDSNYGKSQYYSDEEKAKYGEVSFNCCEKILHGGNLVYGLGLDPVAECVSAPFGLGMGIKSVCGAVTGSLMVLGAKYCNSIANQSNVKTIAATFLERVEKELGSIYCSDLRPKYFVEEDPKIGCHAVVSKVAEIVDQVIAENHQD